MKKSVEKWLKEQMPDEDPAIFQEIYAEYKNTATALVNDLKAQFASNAPFETIDRVAHTLKGNALMVGDTELFEIVQTWRGNLKNGDKASCASALPAIEQLVLAL